MVIKGDWIELFTLIMNRSTNGLSFKIILMMCAGSLMASLIFGFVISITSSTTYWNASFAILCILFTLLFASVIWVNLLTPFWDNHVPDDTKDSIYKIWLPGVLILLVFVLYPLGMFGGSTWTGKGVINLFEGNTIGSNERLVVDMRVNTRFLWNKEYEIELITGQDGKTATFEQCRISGPIGVCTDLYDQQWTIEIVEEPDRPSMD